MHIEILDEKRKVILSKLNNVKDIDDFYLAGGTSLSLQLGLRVSYDFDFFTQKLFNEEVLLAELRSSFENVIVIQQNSGTLDLKIEDVQVSFFYYPYPLINKTISCDSYENIMLAGFDDIAAMKISAIGGRGSKKDFFDLYHIYKLVEGFNSKRMMDNLDYKFNKTKDCSYMIMALNYFMDAEEEELPICLVKYNWEEIKKFFINEQRRLEKIVG